MIFRDRSAIAPGEQTRKGRVAARWTRIKSRSRSCMFWIEDHSRIVVGCSAATLILTTSGLLLWKWAEFINLAMQIGAVLGIWVIIITASLKVHDWLKSRSAKRRPPRGPDTGGSTASPDAPPPQTGGVMDLDNRSEEDRPVERV
jgi:hypothetical protein